MESFNSDLVSLLSKNRWSPLLSKGTWGLEREALRINAAGDLAVTPHPAAFGDKQSNPRITTDFSESQLEMITPPCESITEVYRELKDIHREVRDGIGNEGLWPLSMPGRLPDDERIPIARYGAEKEPEIYRKGLALRYGKKMQLISGIHYNYSFAPELLRLLYRYSRHSATQQYPDFVDALYFSVARNFLRFRWLLLYLFGASPVFDESYEHEMLSEIDAAQVRNATSLRMSRLGYYTSLQNDFCVSYNSKHEYIRDLKNILNTRSERYSKLGLRKDGEPVQLNDFIIQKESEFYSPIRFKQTNLKGETQLEALEKRGIAYLEMRVLDLDPFNPNGVELTTLYFTHTLMLYCLLADSPAIGRQDLEEFDHNHYLVALAGRTKGLQLSRKGKSLELSVWAREVLHDLLNVAALLDRNDAAGTYSQSVRLQLQKLEEPALLPSAIIEGEMRRGAHDMTSYGLAKAGAFQEDMQNVEAEKGVNISIETPNLERLAFLANHFIRYKPAIKNVPAQCS